MAHDIQQDRPVSLKVSIAGSALDGSDPGLNREADFLRRLSPSPYVPTLLDELVVPGSNGSHRCTVTEVLPTLMTEQLLIRCWCPWERGSQFS
jgi:serine/threonine protein kinase